MKLLKQVKIFYASSTKEMQTQINVWLEENENILILKMLQSVTDDMGINMLGSFGMGLKSGLFTLSDNFNIISGMKGDDYQTEFEYDHIEWAKDLTKWDLPSTCYEKDVDQHGTTITINKVTKIILNANKTQYLKNDIAKRYRSFIKSGNVKITVNNVEVNVEELNWSDNYPIPFSVSTKYGEINGKIGLMKESSQKGYCGFDIFRNGRMIVTNSKFAIGFHPTTARICGEINLDFVKVSHEKNKFIEDSPEYEEAVIACKNSPEFKVILREAKKKNEDSENKKEDSVLSKNIDAGLPLMAQAIKELEYDMPSTDDDGLTVIKKKNGRFMDLLGRFTSKKHKPSEKRIDPKSNDPKTTKTGGTHSGDLFQIGDKKFKITYEYVYVSSMGRKDIQFNEDNKILNVYINKSYAGFKRTKDKVAYCLETLNDAIIEFKFKDSKELIGEMNEQKENLFTLFSKYMENCKNNFEGNGEVLVDAEEENIPEVI
jgi:hypothetical protein